MADEAYYRWIEAGKPYNLARPVSECCNVVRGHGFTVYHYPDEPHQLADPAQDHTPYSETGWPVWSREWWAHAIDIMPPSAAALAAGAVPLPVLARQIIADRNAGVPGTEWIKYMNWTDENGICRQERWMPDHETRSSTDKGHIHISGRSDMDASDVVSRTGWDPVERAKMSDYSEAQMRAFPWQYNGRGIGENNGDTVQRSTLSYFDEMLKILRRLNAALPPGLDAKLDAILAAALDDTNVDVILPPDVIADLEEIKSAIAALPKAVLDEEAARLAS